MKSIDAFIDKYCDPGLYADPKDLHRNGVKDDSLKPDLDIVLGEFPRALWEVGKIGTYGYRKYTKNGWVSVPNGISRYSSAELRHYLLHKIEGKFDKESELLHKAHKAWNALADLELACREDENWTT